MFVFIFISKIGMIYMSGLSRNTKIFGFASFLVDVSSEMVLWILPFFLNTVLGAPVFIVGLIDALRESVSKIVGVLSGFYSDRTGKRKNMILFGYSLSAIVKAFLIFATHWFHVLAVVFFERFGKGIREAPRDALIVLSEKKENLGKAFGFRQALDTTGAIIGPLIAAAIIAYFLKDGNANAADVYRLIFAVSLIPATIAVLVLFFVKEEQTAKNGKKHIFEHILKAKNFKHFAFASLVFAIGEFTIAFFLLRAGEFVGIIFIPLLGMAYNVFYAMGALPIGKLTDRIGPKKTLTLSWGIFVFILAGFMLFTGMQSLIVLFGLLGIFTAMSKVAPSVYLGKTVDKNEYATATGLYQGITGIVALPANFIASMFWNVRIFDAPAAFVFSIVTTLAAVILLNFFVKE